MADIPPPQVYHMTKTAFSKVPQADGPLIAGGGAPVYAIVDALDMDLGKPVVAHHVASVWQALRLTRVQQPIQGYGRLRTTFGAPGVSSMAARDSHESPDKGSHRTGRGVVPASAAGGAVGCTTP